MRRPRAHLASLPRVGGPLLLVLGLLFGAAACGSSSDSGTSGVVVGEVAEDFALADVNATSATHMAAVTPRGYLGSITAWYFGSST